MISGVPVFLSRYENTNTMIKDWKDEEMKIKEWKEHRKYKDTKTKIKNGRHTKTQKQEN